MDLTAVIHRWGSGLGAGLVCLELGAALLLGCRSTDPNNNVEPTPDQEKAEDQASAEHSARPEEGATAADPGVDYDGPVSPEGYRLLDEKDRREPLQGSASIPDLPPEEKARVEQTLATMEEFARELEKVHSLDYCRAAKETAPMDAWESKLTTICTHKGKGLRLFSAGPDRIEKSKDDVRWGFSIPKPKTDERWINSPGTF